MSENLNSTTEQPPRRPHRTSLFWPLILISVGVVLLLQNLGLTGGFWGILWKFWPVLLLAIAADALIFRREVVGPVLFGGLGAVLLLNNFDLLGWDVWNVLWRMWPLLIVAFGLEIIFRRRHVWTSAVAVVLVLGAMVGAIWIGKIGAPKPELQTIAVELGDVSTADIRLAPAVGNLDVDTLVDSNDLIAGTANASNTNAISSRVTTSGSKAIYTLDYQYGFVFPGSGSWDWDLGLTSRIPLDLETSNGVGKMKLDLVELMLSDLEASQAVGEIDIQLPNPADESYRVSVSQAIGSIIIEVPAGANIRLEVSRAISGFTLPTDFDRQGDFFYSPDYDREGVRIDIDISQAIGNIVVRYK